MATYYNLFYYIIRLFSVSFRGKIVSFSRKPRFSACARSEFLLQLRQQGGGTVNTQKRNLCAAGVLLTAAATMVVLFLFRLSQPDKAQQSIFLNCTASDRGGWTFYTEAGQTEPVFGFGGYIDGVPAEGAGPVVAERIMEEPGERCFLQFSCFNAGLQVFLGDILLYTDFPQQENRVDVFLQNADFAGINYNGLCIPLPQDCAGKALRIVTYGPSLNGLRVPVFPSQASRFSDAVVQTTGVVWCMTAVTVRLMLALSLLLVLVLGAQAGQPLWKLLPLSGYFLLAAVSGVCNTFLESASGLNADSSLLNWVYLIHMDFLYIYLAAELRGKKRWGLAATALLHILLTALRSFAAVPLLIEKVGDWLGFSLLVVAIVLMLFSHEEMQRRISWCLCAVAAFLFLIWGVTRYVGVEVLYPFSNPVTSMLGGYPHAFYALLCNVAGLLCAVQVVVEFVRSMLLRQRQMQMMEISSQTAQEKYEQAQASVRQTASFRHEWKNHIAALHLLAQRQDQTELRNYLDRLDGELEQLSPRNFTANPTVNTIFQRFAAQAKKKDVTFRVSAVLPEMLQIREDDLCSLLFNMLDNALEAAAQTEQGEILCSMQIRRQYLAIRCENTYSGTLRTDKNGEILTTKNDASDHGFGLMKMRAIAKKYGSVLDISYDENRFTVMTALKLLPEKKNQ